MALQLAYHKTHNRPTATYETASTRLFSRGRTEVIRTFSEDSWKWVKAMREGKTDVSEPFLFSHTASEFEFELIVSCRCSLKLSIRSFRQLRKLTTLSPESRRLEEESIDT